MKAISVRLEPLQMNKIKHNKEHDERTYPKSKIPKYIDTQRSYLNSVIIKYKSEKEIIDEIEKRRSKANSKQKQKLKSNARLLYSGIVTFSTEAQPIVESLNKEQQDELFLKIAKSVADFLNTDLVSLSVHRDETAIHAHFSVYAYNRKGEPLSRFVKPSTLSQLQDVAAKVVEPLGITRGVRKYERLKQGDDYSKIIHRSVKELHRDLPIEIEKRKQEILMLEKKITQLKSEVQQTQQRKQEMEQQIAKYQKQLNELKTSLSNLQNVKEKLQNEKQAMEQQISTYQKQVNELNMSITNLDKTKQKIQQEIAKEQEKQDEERKRKQELINEINRLVQERQLLETQVKEWQKVLAELESQIKEMKEVAKQYDIEKMRDKIKEMKESIKEDNRYIYATARYIRNVNEKAYEQLIKSFPWLPEFMVDYEKNKQKKQSQQENTQENTPPSPDLY